MPIADCGYQAEYSLFTAEPGPRLKKAANSCIKVIGKSISEIALF
jgi:hypothetical protein